MMPVNIHRKSINDMSPVIYDIVQSGGSVRLDIKGNSMLPLLRSEKDSVLLKKAENIKKFDVVLFKNSVGNIAIHRVVKIDDDSFTIIGDNQYTFDCNIRHDRLIAKAVSFYRNGRCIGEKRIRLFGAFWFMLFPLRRIARKVLLWIKRHLPACIRSLKNKSR